MTHKPKKVLVAMSGGVDSSVAAALLQEQGFFAVGGFMKNFSRESWKGVLEDDCPWEEDWKDVQRVCEKLGLESRSFNFEKEYREKVIEYFFREYKEGRTPNPDIMCNKEIKFGIFLDKARELGFDYVATGHYARIGVRNQESGIRKYELLKGVDSKKDQSYFLYTLTQEQLSHVLFPIGEYAKSQVRDLARKFGLPNAEKKDSQGICFVGHIELKEFLKQRIPEKQGMILDTSGKELGQHDGAWYYTIGQRHGLGIGGGRPLYVVSKDVMSNTVTVAQERKSNNLYSKIIQIHSIHWIENEPVLPLRCSAKIRYQHPDGRCEVQNYEDSFQIIFDEPQFAPASGQSVVLYDDEKVLGGGVIV